MFGTQSWPEWKICSERKVLGFIVLEFAHSFQNDAAGPVWVIEPQQEVQANREKEPEELLEVLVIS